MKCKYCGSKNVIKYGKSKGKQCYFCKDCKHKFVDNGTFVKIRIKDKVIVTALDLYFEGLSVRKVQRQIAKIFGVKVSQVSIWKWIMKYSKLVKEFVNNFKVELCGKFHVDETMIKCNGEYKWFWEIIDADTKFLVATHLSGERTIEEVIKLFKQSKERSTERPKRVVVDGLWAYEKGFKKVFYSRYKEHRVEFVRRAGIKARETNNIVERLHGTLKDRLKPLRGLKSEKTAKIWLDGWFVYYNFLRPHLSLKGKTPAEACGIDLKIENGWEDLIKEATYYQTKLARFVSNGARMETQ